MKRKQQDGCTNLPKKKRRKIDKKENCEFRCSENITLSKCMEFICDKNLRNFLTTKNIIKLGFNTPYKREFSNLFKEIEKNRTNLKNNYEKDIIVHQSKNVDVFDMQFLRNNNLVYRDKYWNPGMRFEESNTNKPTSQINVKSLKSTDVIHTNDNYFENKEILTSLDVEKDKKLLNTIRIPKPWSIGLIINLAGKYKKNGQKLKYEDKIKCLTVLYITCWSTEKVQEMFNKKETVPCTTLRNYCGLLPVLFSISGFNSLDEAKLAFLCWKQKTRNGFSRFMCGLELYEIFKKKSTNLKYYVTKLSPKDNIGLLSEVGSKD